MFRKKSLQITIPQPCHKKWDEMPSTEKGKFCQSCQKEVIDFTNMTDVEVLHFAKANKYSFCGSFQESQLNRSLRPPSKQSPFGYKKIAASILALLSFKFSPGQSLQKSEQKIIAGPKKDLNNTSIKNALTKDYIISGEVTLPFKDSLEFANVTIKIGNDDTTYFLDASGRFSIRLNENQIKEYTIISFIHPRLKNEVRTIHKISFPSILKVELDYAPSGRTGGMPIFQ